MKQWYRKSQRDLHTGTDTRSIWEFSLAKRYLREQDWGVKWLKGGVLFVRGKNKQSHSIVRYRSKVKKQIILHPENKNVVILYPPSGPSAGMVTAHFALTTGKKNIMRNHQLKTTWKPPFPFSVESCGIPECGPDLDLNHPGTPCCLRQVLHSASQ